MKLSWIIPVYNSGVLLDEAVHSILANMPSKCDCEIILVNDCSTDLETIRSLDGWKRLLAIKVLNQPENGGPARARNAGLLASTGDWVAFLDADDVVAPGSVEERLMAIAKYSEIRWIVGDMLETREAGKNFHLNSFPKATKEGNELSKNLFKVSQPVAKIALWHASFSWCNDDQTRLACRMWPVKRGACLRRGYSFLSRASLFCRYVLA